MRNYFTFNGISSKDFGVYISGSGTFDGAERDIESISVPGRNGELTIDNGRYKNRVIEYPAFIYRDFPVNVDGLRNFLLSQSGYKRLEDSYHSEEFYLARYRGDFKADVIENLKGGNFVLSFDAYPQRFLKTGEIPVAVATGSSLWNETSQIAKPLIRAYGTGTISINGYALTVSSANQYTDIDCDLQEAYKGTTNCNGNVSGTFPELMPGANAITITGFSQTEIIPRWWKL